MGGLSGGLETRLLQSPGLMNDLHPCISVKAGVRFRVKWVDLEFAFTIVLPQYSARFSSLLSFYIFP